ncbi:MAG: glycosyltransferase family 2 protein [Clostridia bacterium]|nr:glycosyltransferase family 2 protein [Clostridia bacterium]
MVPTLYFVVPCYNEEEVLPLTGPVFAEKLKAFIDNGEVSENSRVLFVNDGSRDKTWDLILDLHSRYPLVTGIDLEENCGEKNALIAGMYHASRFADCVITMDCDLQDDVEVTGEMLEKYKNGNDLVLGVRDRREDDPFSERFCSAGFYLMMRLLRTGLVKQHSNFRLMSKRAIDALRPYEQIPYFLPAVASNLPFPKTTVSHARAARRAGHSKYNYKSRLRLALDSALVHSPVLPAASWTGLFLCAAAAVAGLVLLLVFGLRDGVFSGWAFVLFTGGALGSLGFAVMSVWLTRLGLYKTYAQKKHIPGIKSKTD